MSILRPVGPRFVEASLQCIEGGCHHVLHLAAPGSAVSLAVDQIPPVAHLEDIRALQHAVPYHGEGSDVLPGLEVAGLEFSELQLRGDDHVPQSVVGLEHLWVAEVGGSVAVIDTLQRPAVVLRPSFEVGRCGAHHYLAVGQQNVVTSVIDVIEPVLFVIYSTACAERSILLCSAGTSGDNLAERLVVGTVLCRDCPEGVVAGTVVVILLQIHHPSGRRRAWGRPDGLSWVCSRC